MKIGVFITFEVKQLCMFVIADGLHGGRPDFLHCKHHRVILFQEKDVFPHVVLGLSTTGVIQEDP